MGALPFISQLFLVLCESPWCESCLEDHAAQLVHDVCLVQKLFPCSVGAQHQVPFLCYPILLLDRTEIVTSSSPLNKENEIVVFNICHPPQLMAPHMYHLANICSRSDIRKSFSNFSSLGWCLPCHPLLQRRVYAWQATLLLLLSRSNLSQFSRYFAWQLWDPLLLISGPLN